MQNMAAKNFITSEIFSNNIQSIMTLVFIPLGLCPMYLANKMNISVKPSSVTLLM